MYDDDFDDDDLPIVAETEVTREQIKRGLLDGRWKIHCRDAHGVTWFVQNDAPAPPLDDFVDDLPPGPIAAKPAEPEPEPFDITAADWFPELQATAPGELFELPDDIAIRFRDQRPATDEGSDDD